MSECLFAKICAAFHFAWKPRVVSESWTGDFRTESWSDRRASLMCSGFQTDVWISAQRGSLGRAIILGQVWVLEWWVSLRRAVIFQIGSSLGSVFRELTERSREESESSRTDRSESGSAWINMTCFNTENWFSHWNSACDSMSLKLLKYHTFSKNWSFCVIVTRLSTELSLCFTCGSERQTLMELGWGSMMTEEELLVLPHVAPLILRPCSLKGDAE